MKKLFVIAVILLVIQPLSYGAPKKRAQGLLPKELTKDLVLKPSKTPYLCNGILVKRGATLTILPGAVLKQKAGNGVQYAHVVVEGTLKMGSPKRSKYRATITDGWFDVFGGTVKISNAYIAVRGFKFEKGAKGTIVNSELFDLVRSGRDRNYSMRITPPKKGLLAFKGVFFNDINIHIKSDLPADRTHLIFLKCGFVMNAPNGAYYLYERKLGHNIFAYGSRCDLYGDSFSPGVTWKLTAPSTTVWYVDNLEIYKKIRKQLAPSGLRLKNGKPNTLYKPSTVEKKKK